MNGTVNDVEGKKSNNSTPIKETIDDANALKRSRDDKENEEEGEIEQNSNDTKKKLKIEPSSETKDDEEKTKTEEDKKEQEKPKFVFGSTTSFGAGFGVKTSTKEKEESSKDNSKPFAFGSGLSFGSGFGVLKKPDEEEEPKTEQKPEEETKTADSSDTKDGKEESVIELPTEKESEKKSKEATKDDENVIKLTKREIKSGEESEVCVFQANAKLYQLSDLKSGWKERGTGNIKLNEDPNTKKARIVMRSRGILKVILNLPLIKGFSIQKGFPGSLNGEKFVRIIAIDDNKHPVQYALRIGKEETASELYDKIINLIPK